jgi:hypothetical protein
MQCRDSTLPLLVARVGRADDPHDAVPPDDLALAADFLDGCQNLHLGLSRNVRRSLRCATGNAGASDTCYLSSDT